MAERLTEQKTTKGITKIVIRNSFEISDVVHKLYLLEDIMEEYNIKSISQLKARLSGEDKSHKSAIGYMKDRDTWKRACELACETLKQVMGKPLWIGGNIPTPEVKDSDYFYQQAKKEGEQK